MIFYYTCFNYPAITLIVWQKIIQWILSATNCIDSAYHYRILWRVMIRGLDTSAALCEWVMIRDLDTIRRVHIESVFDRSKDIETVLRRNYFFEVSLFIGKSYVHIAKLSLILRSKNQFLMIRNYLTASASRLKFIYFCFSFFLQQQCGLRLGKGKI